MNLTLGTGSRVHGAGKRPPGQQTRQRGEKAARGKEGGEEEIHDPSGLRDKTEFLQRSEQSADAGHMFYSGLWW